MQFLQVPDRLLAMTAKSAHVVEVAKKYPALSNPAKGGKTDSNTTLAGEGPGGRDRAVEICGKRRSGERGA